MIGVVGRIGAVGGARYVSPSLPMGAPDFTLSGASVSTAWASVTVGTLTPINAPPGAYFMLVETAAASGDEAVVGHWRAFFVRLPAGYAALNQRFAMLGFDTGGLGSYNNGNDWVVRIPGGALSSPVGIRQRLQLTDGTAWTSTESNIETIPQLAAGTVYLVVTGVANTGTNSTPVWRNFAAVCPVGGSAASQVGATATAATFLSATTMRVFHQLFPRTGSTRTPADVAMEETAYVTGDFPWDTTNNRPHHAALEALAASGGNPFLTYEALISAQNAGTLPYANCRPGKGRADFRFTLRNLAGGLTNSGTAGGTLAEDGTPGGLADVASIAPSHWLGGAPAIAETVDKFIPGAGLRAFTFSGSYGGGTTALERRWTLRGTATPVAGRDWADIAGISGGNWSFTETMPVGNFDLEVRDKNSPALTTTSTDWLSGTRVLLHGQSGMALSVRTGFGTNPLGPNLLNVPVASGAQGITMRLNNMYTNGGSGGSYAAPAPVIGRMRSGETPNLGHGAINYLNEWNAINPGHPLMICNMAINTHSMDNWAANDVIPDGHATWRFLGPATPTAPGPSDGNASGVVSFFALLLGSYVDAHQIMWTPGMSAASGTRAAYVAAIDARFSNAVSAPWLVFPPWRGHRSNPDVTAGATVRERHIQFVTELGARGILGPSWNDTVSDGTGGLHAAYNTSTGVPDPVQPVSDANHVGQGRLGRGFGRALAWAFDRRVKAHGPRLVGAWFEDGTRTKIQIELGRAVRTLNAAALYAGQFWISTDNGANFSNTGFSAALSADGTRAVLTKTSGAWPATDVRAEIHAWWPFGPSEIADEANAEAALHGLLYDNQLHRGGINLAPGVRAGNPAQGTNRAGAGLAGVAVAARGAAKLVATARFTGSRSVTVRMMAADGVTMLRERALVITAS